jgi:hypothetical protein
MCIREKVCGLNAGETVRTISDLLCHSIILYHPVQEGFNVSKLATGILNEVKLRLAFPDKVQGFLQKLQIIVGLIAHGFTILEMIVPGGIRKDLAREGTPNKVDRIG